VTNVAIINWQQTSPTGGGNLASISLLSLNKILRVEAHGGITFPIITTTSTGPGLNDAVMMGIQAIPHGNTPLALPANISAADWLLVEQRIPGEGVLGWAPSTATAAATAGGGFRMDWTGQKFYGASTDLVFTDGQSTGYTGVWESFGTMRVWYT
jgi:hypothetical protein